VKKTIAGAVLVLCTLVGIVAYADDGHNILRHLSARLSGYNEIPTSFSSTGSARLVARISRDETEIDWELSYKDMESPVTQAHIHFANKHNAGPVVVFFCTNLGNGPAGTQPCPAQPATISGTITAAQITAGGAPNGLEAGNMPELIAAIRAGATYANVHTTGRPGGETRGQIGGDDHRDHR
jgi:hypothetical protein